MVGRRGFTLIEMLLALSLGGLVLLVAHRLFAGVTDGTRRLDEARVALDRMSNARRWLVEAFGSLDVGSNGAGGFTGRPEQVEFASWSLDARGRHQRGRVSLLVEGELLVARASAGEPIALVDSVQGLAFDYLLEPGAQTRWVREWLSSVSAPVAVRLRVSRHGGIDTLLLLVGSRG